VHGTRQLTGRLQLTDDLLEAPYSQHPPEDVPSNFERQSSHD
jgi:hypothetical protein